MQTSAGSETRGWWIFLISVLIYAFIGTNLSFEQYVSKAMGVPDTALPGDSPPFYFIREHFVRGVCAGVAVLLSFVLVAVTWKRFPHYSGITLWMSWLWLMPHVCEALMIYGRCPHLLDANKAASAWNTDDEFLNDPLRRAVEWGNLLFAVAMALVLSRWWRREEFAAANAGPSKRPDNAEGSVP